VGGVGIKWAEATRKVKKSANQKFLETRFSDPFSSVARYPFDHIFDFRDPRPVIFRT